MFLTFSGSIASGTDTSQSDIDIRGIVLPTVQDLLYCPHISADTNLHYGQHEFEQYEDNETDTVIYSLDKAMYLLSNCNASLIELLGCKPEHYTHMTPYGKLLIDNRYLFLSKRVYNTFTNYARGQLQRLKNAIGNDNGSNVFHCINLCDSLNRITSHLEQEYVGYKKDMVKFFITDSVGNPITVNGIPIDAYDVSILFNEEKTVVTVNGKEIPDKEVELRVSLNADKIPYNTFMGVTNEITSTIKEFNKHLGNRNKKKDSYHLNKHCMHLIRLYFMAEDILLNNEIITYREKEHDFLMSIKSGKYYVPEKNTMTKEFFDLVASMDVRLNKALELSKLPDRPDITKINNLVQEIKWGYLQEKMKG